MFRSILWMIVLFILVSPPDVNCQVRENINFTHITTEDGLSHHEILFVVQDTQGFMWFGTKHGLNKYDGMSIVSYFQNDNSKDSSSLGGNFTHWIHEDQTGALWIATWGDGISKYDPKSDKFTNYYHIKNNPQSIASNNVWSLFVDSNGFIWAATDDGLSKLNPETGTFVHYRHDPKNPNSLSHNTVSRIREDDQGIFWISTYGGGLNRFDPKAEIFTNYKHRQDDPKSLSNNNLWGVFIDSRKRIWIASEKGLNRFNPKTETFTSYQHDKTNPNSLSSNTITFIHEDHEGILWLGTFGGGLNRFDPEREIFVHYRHDPQNRYSLANDIVMSIYEDTTGSIWVATYGGVDKYDPGEHQFEHYNTTLNSPKGLSNPKVRSIFQDSKGSIWVGTGGGGLNQINKARNSFIHFLHDDNDQTSIGDNDIWAIDQDKRGDLWIATHGAGLNKFISEQKTFIRYKHDPDDSNTPACNPLYDLKVDKKRDVLWIAAYLSGLDKFDIVNNTFTHYRYDPDNPDGIVSNWSTSIFVDSKGFVWVGTETGLSLFNPETELFTNFKHIVNDPKSLSANMIQAIFEDSQNVIWIGTGSGLNRYEEGTHSFKRYSEKNGLAGNHVAGIREDNKGHLWISTDKGLSKFNPQNETFRNYDQHDGLQGNSFFMHSAHSNESGELFFGGTNGFNAFSPNELRDNKHVPRVVFTDFQIFNQSVPIGEGSVLTQHINQSQQISLDHDQSVFRIEFTALNFRNSQKNQYAYMMEGFDKDFTYTDSNNRSATYTNLDSGHYTFHVKGSNNDGVWNEESKSIKIIILAPWWETLWFRGAIFMLVTGFILGAVRFRIRSIQQLNKQLEMQVEDRTVKLQNELKERKHTEEMLHIEKNNLSNIFESMNDGIYIVNQQYDIQFVNHAIKNEFGSYEGKKCFEYFHDRQGVCTWCKHLEVFSGKTVHWEWYFFKNKKTYDLMATPLMNPDGTISKLEIFRDITDRKQAEQALQQSESQLRQIIDLVPHFIFVKDDTGKFEIVNKATAEVFGTTVEDLTGRRDSEFVATEEEIAHFRSDDLEVIHSGKTKFIPEEPITDSENNIRYLQTTKVPFKFSETKEPSLLGVAVDITERKQAEEKLQQSEKNLLSIFENMQDVYYKLDANGKIIVASPSAVNLYKCDSLDEIIGKHANDFVYNVEDNEKLTEELQRKGFVKNYAIQHKRQNDEPIFVETNTTLTFDEQGQPDGVVGVFRDISERKTLEKGLVENEERLRLALSAANQGLYDLNIQTGEAKVNPEYALMLGYNPATFSETNQKWIERLHPDDLETVSNAYRAYLNGEIPEYRVEFRQRMKSGEWKWIISVGEIFEWDDQEQPLRMLGTHTDISEIKQAEAALQDSHDKLEQRVEERTNELRKIHEQLLHSEKLSAIGSLSASIAHEFNSPLAGVTNVIRGIRKRASFDEEDTELIDLAIKECRRMKDLILNLQSFNRPSSGITAFTDIHEIIDSLLLLSKKQFHLNQISVEKEYADNLPQIQAVADQIKQVILNLLNNSANACEKGGLITINTEKNNGNIVLRVRDNGTGIKPEDIGHIFEPFFSTKPEVKGTGLGLSVSYGIVKKHGGRIDVESEPGKGSVFSVTLPISGVIDA